MKHFAYVRDVCLAALTGDKARGAASVRSLQKSLAADGDTEDAELLARLIKAARGSGKEPVVQFVQSAKGTK